MRLKKKQFRLKEEHIKLLSSANISWDRSEYGAPAINCKRPYGSSDVVYCFAKILGLNFFEDEYGEKHLQKEQLKKCETLHKETELALQIILSTKSFEPGLYEYGKSWVKI